MGFYTVHQSPELTSPAGLEGPRRERPVFIKEGFSLQAFFMPVIWPLLHGQFIAFVVLALANAVLLGLAWLLALPLYAIAGIFLAGNILTAFEAGNWRRRTVEKKGWKVVNVLEARSLKDVRRTYREVLRVNALDQERTAPPVIAKEPPAPAQHAEPEARLMKQEPEPEVRQAPEPEVQRAPEPAPVPQTIVETVKAKPLPAHLIRRMAPEPQLQSLLGNRDQPRQRDKGAMGPPKLNFEGESPAQSSHQPLTRQPSGAKERPRRRRRRS